MPVAVEDVLADGLDRAAVVLKKKVAVAYAVARGPGQDGVAAAPGDTCNSPESKVPFSLRSCQLRTGLVLGVPR